MESSLSFVIKKKIGEGGERLEILKAKLNPQKINSIFFFHFKKDENA